MSAISEYGAEFGIRLPVAGPLASRESITKAAVAAEDLGFDAVWVHDFVAFTSYQNQTHVSCGSVEAVEAAGPDAPPVFFESLTNLAYLAGVTKRVKLGVAVLCIPYRQPVVAAKQVANIDALSDGRLILGIGVGAAAVTHNVDFEVLGVARNTKYAMTRDYLTAMMEIWQQPEPQHDGRFVSFPATQVDPKPVQKPYPPIWVGGGGPKSVDLAAEFADGWLPPWISPDQYPARIRELEELAAEKGRPGKKFTIATEVYAGVAETDEQAISNSMRTLGVLPEGFADDARPEAINAAGLVGSPETVAKRLADYIRAGVNHFELKFIYHDIDHLHRQLEMFTVQTVPLVESQLQ